jgi:hypothetical protein
MINDFQNDFYTRLRSWNALREKLTDCDIAEQCIETDRFWQQCPMSNHYLHPHEMDKWPDPWQLLDDNLYCSYARALGMVYTLRLLGIKDVDLVDCLDYNNENVVLVLVDNAKYLLNHWPNTVLNNKLQDFKVVRRYDLSHILKKTGTI